jgi:excisionase family DNA binding protein
MKYLTVGEVAERLCVSKAAVYALCSREGAAIRHLRLGAARTTIRIPADALDDYLAGATVEAWAAPHEPPAPPRRFLKESTIR